MVHDGSVWTLGGAVMLCTAAAGHFSPSLSLTQSYIKTEHYFSHHSEDKSAAAWDEPGLLTQTI